MDLPDINPTAILGALRLALDAYSKLRSAPTPAQKEQVIEQAQKLIQLASDQDIAAYDTAQRRAIRGGVLVKKVRARSAAKKAVRPIKNVAKNAAKKKAG